jgi:hypothetical protein
MTATSSQKPGPAFDSVEFWVAGHHNNGSCFLRLWNGTSWLSADEFLGSNSTILDLKPMRTIVSSPSNGFLDSDELLLVIGNIEVPDMPSLSAALFSGTGFVPDLSTKLSSGEPGTLSSMFSTQIAPAVRKRFILDSSLQTL